MLLWLSQVAFGQPFVVDVGDPVEIRSAGAWIRVFPTEGDWVAALGSNQVLCWHIAKDWRCP